MKNPLTTLLSFTLDHLWSEPQPGDFLPPEWTDDFPPDPEIIWLGVGDDVLVVGPQGGYVGVILETNPDEQTALVCAWDSEAGACFTHWWSIQNVYPIDAEAPEYAPYALTEDALEAELPFLAWLGKETTPEAEAPSA